MSLKSSVTKLVESLEKQREPIPALEAIYIITPTPRSVQIIINDFADDFFLTYKRAHVFFTEDVKTLKEIDMAFVPLESQVFTLHSPKAFTMFYKTSVKGPERSEFTEILAEQLATVCASLGEYPSIRFRQESSRLSEFSKIFKDKLDIYKKDDPRMGEGSQQKCRSEILLLDRGFDVTSALLHEMTYQAMAYDLLNIENDVFRYETIAEDIKKFGEKEKLPMSDNKMKDLQQLLKKAPEYQKQVRQFLAHFSIAEKCMNRYQEIADKLCAVEQDMATGLDKDGVQVKETVRHVIPLMHDPKVSNENLEKFFEHGHIPSKDREAILNMVFLGLPVTLESSKKSKVVRKEREETFYLTSRWVPVIKDMIEDAISGSLSVKLYPYSMKRSLTSTAASPIVSARKTNVHRPEKLETRDVPRLIVFVIGGVTYSEIRAVYEVTKATKDWDVFIGSDCVLTPSLFVDKLASLSE